MPTGLYRTGEEWVMVESGGHRVLLSRESYVFAGLKPDFETLPSEQDYETAKTSKPDHPRGRKPR